MKKCLLYGAALVLLTGVLSATAMACCYTNVKIHNNTGQDAWDFRVVLTPNRTVVGHYDGHLTGHHFHGFRTWNQAGNTILKWFDPFKPPPPHPADTPAPIPHCSRVHLGWYLNAPAKIKSACWTDKEQHCIGPAYFPGHWVCWRDISNGVAAFSFGNFLEDLVDVTVADVRYAILDDEIPLEALNDSNAALMAQLQLLDPGPYTIAPGKAELLYIPEPVEPGQWVVYRFTDIEQEIVVWGMHEMESRVIPTVTQWGLIALLVVLAGIATWVVLKRRRVVTA